MSLFRPDRNDRQGDRFLEWKVRLFAVGATLGLTGIFLDVRPLVWLAIAVLAAGFALRFLPNSRKADSEEG